jgi:DNA-binding MarR family transcriptional regulator
VQDPLQTFPGYLLRRASSALTAKLSRRLATLDLRIADMSILFFIEANPGITQSELGRLLDIQRANMTPITAKLGARGLISRATVDGRSQGLELTSAGAALSLKARTIADTFERELIERVAPNLRAHVAPVLTALWLRDDVPQRAPLSLEVKRAKT